MSRSGTDSTRKYVTAACRECKRIRRKCNGETPCETCSQRGSECLYDMPRRRGPTNVNQIAAENAVLRLEEERLRETIARLSRDDADMKASDTTAGQPSEVGILTPQERGILRSYFELTNRLFPVG